MDTLAQDVMNVGRIADMIAGCVPTTDKNPEPSSAASSIIDRAALISNRLTGIIPLLAEHNTRLDSALNPDRGYPTEMK